MTVTGQETHRNEAEVEPKSEGAKSSRYASKEVILKKRPLYVGNLDHGVTTNNLSELFAQFGMVLSVTVPTDFYRGGNRGFGFVEFERPDAAANAMEALNDREFRGRRLKIEWGH